MRTTPVPLTGARGATPPPLNDQLGLLESQLQTALPRWHRARLNGLAKALLALIVASSANLTKVARACAGRAKVASHHRRLQRLLAGFVPFVSDGALARLLAAWSGVEPPWVLARLYPILKWRRGSKLGGHRQVIPAYVYSTRGGERRAVGVCPFVYSSQLAARASPALRRAPRPG